MLNNKEKSFNKNIDIKLWKEIMLYSLPYKKLIIALSVVMLLVAGVDAILPLLTRYAIDNYIVAEDLNGLYGFSIIYLVIIIIQGINIFAFIYFAGKLETEMAASIREKAFTSLQELSLSFYNQRPVGWLIARLTSDVHKLSSIISWGIVDFVWGFAMMFTIVIIMLRLNYRLALITLVVLPVLLIISFYFQKKILHEFRLVRKINSKITGAFNEGISGAKTSKTLVIEDRNCDEFTGLTNKMAKSSIKAAIYSSLFLPAVLVLSSVGTGLALWQGGNAVIQGAITYGTLVAFISYTVQFFEPVREMARVFAELQSAQAAAERIISLINTESEIVDSKLVIEKYGTILKPKKENWPEIKGNIEFRNVEFKYTDNEEVLNNFNLNVSAGQKIALVGETGSGKSTIVNLLCRFYEPVDGEIYIDGKEYRNFSQSLLHSNIGYVLQDPHLFSGTIKENIRYGFENATDAEIKNAADLVQATRFINKLPDGFDTEVGEGGDLLSTGEKQLISFARAIISNPAIFILDEATSSIDTEMELIIQKTINKVLKNRTSFIIAHRLSTIKNADKIIVLKDGKIIESGNHYQLIDRKGYYYDLYQNQFYNRRESRKTRITS
ncbi:ABC transporter ATP-binding protein [Halanaerobiaceae bacterium Z-7014]|uniref:ABC transporter ATP-binding protein n=1 Tax=Halonatronomonas betaini TaxID=2778430 RepID=A0A931AQE5_9FIRM|nr:ABC transporter ATP-binding protein [Halonatronomonas betaini]MBF8435921.1 ABC transporter ATP-binding protein [Halonatronomonas betaini]